MSAAARAVASLAAEIAALTGGRVGIDQDGVLDRSDVIDLGAPGLRHYHASYYAAFLFDPDGNRIEAVCHRADAG